MRRVQVAVVNASHLADEDVAGGVGALQQQVRQDLAPVWDVDAELSLVTSEQAHAVGRYAHEAAEHPLDCADRERWGLVLLDEGDTRRSARGYHDRTYHGLPMARVLVDRLGAGQDWVHAASHQLLELLVDPGCSAVAYRHPDAATVLFYAREICDPCGAYTDGYEKCGRWVSDFVFPSWFEPATAARNGHRRYDERGLVTEPFEVLPGGYVGVFDPAISAWVLQGSNAGSDEVTQVGSRMERRSTASNRLLDSDMSTAP